MALMLVTVSISLLLKAKANRLTQSIIEPSLSHVI